MSKTNWLDRARLELKLAKRPDIRPLRSDARWWVDSYGWAWINVELTREHPLTHWEIEEITRQAMAVVPGKPN